MNQSRLFVRAGVGFFELVDDLQDTVTANDGVIDDELESGGIFENDGAADEALDTFAMAREEIQTALLLLGIAENADKDYGRVQVAGHIDIIDRNQSRLADRELPANNLSNLSFQEFTDALKSQRGHEDIYRLASLTIRTVCSAWVSQPLGS
jgi:hypothetical protein